MASLDLPPEIVLKIVSNYHKKVIIRIKQVCRHYKRYKQYTCTGRCPLSKFIIDIQTQTSPCALAAAKNLRLVAKCFAVAYDSFYIANFAGCDLFRDQYSAIMHRNNNLSRPYFAKAANIAASKLSSPPRSISGIVSSKPRSWPSKISVFEKMRMILNGSIDQ